MKKKMLSKGLRKRLRFEKARFRREIPDVQEKRERLAKLREELGVPLTGERERAIRETPLAH